MKKSETEGTLKPPNLKPPNLKPPNFKRPQFKGPSPLSEQSRARALSTKITIGGMVLMSVGFLLGLYMAEHEEEYEFFAEWAVFGLFVLVPLGVVVCAVGFFMPTTGKKTEAINAVKKRIRQGGGEYNGHAIPFGKVVQRTDGNNNPLKYPYLVNGLEQPKKFSNTLPIISTLGFLAYLVIVYDNIVDENAYSMAVVLLGLPIVFAVFILFGAIPYIQALGAKVPEPTLDPYKKAFYEDIGLVIRLVQGGPPAQAINAAQLCTKEQRAELIDKIFDDRSTTLHIPIEISVKHTPHSFSFDISRGLRLIAPLDREMLRAVFHLYSYDYISHQNYRYYVGAILAADGQGSIDNYAERISNDDIHEKYMPLSKLNTAASRAFYLIQNNLAWRHNEALSDVLQKVDLLIADYPSDPTIKKVYDMIHQGGKWLTSSDIPSSNYENINSKYFLNLGTLDDGTPLKFSKDGSLITVGGAGSGKTQCLVIPNLLTWAGSAIVLDVKPELWDKTAGYREKAIGPVYKLDFTSDATQKFNPFEYISDDPNQVFGDSLFFANLIIPPSVNGGGNQQFWEDSARNIIQACLIAMVTERSEAKRVSGAVKPPTLKMTELVRMIVNTDDLDDAVEVLMSSDIELCRLLGQSINSQLIGPAKNSGSNVLSSVLAQLWTQVQPLVNPRIEKMTERCNWTPDGLRQRNATLYISLAPGQVAEYAPLLRLILGVHLREYLALSETEAKQRPPMLLMFDEMPQLGYMQAIEQAVETGRSKGIKLWGFLQRLGQLAEQYKDARGFLGNCKAQIYLSPSTEDGTAQMVSEALGTKQDLADGPSATCRASGACRCRFRR